MIAASTSCEEIVLRLFSLQKSFELRVEAQQTKQTKVMIHMEHGAGATEADGSTHDSPRCQINDKDAGRFGEGSLYAQRRVA